MSREVHISYLNTALKLARKAPALSTNFRVGAIIVSDSKDVLATGYTMELPGNTHAEECALSKLGDLETADSATLYTTLEPCGKRLSGRTSCVDRILSMTTNNLKIRKVVFGAKEPNTFVENSESCKKMTEAGLEWEYIPDLADQILEVAKEGHRAGTNVDDISPEERGRQSQMPRNPKKRMMEVPPR